jgi:hypothetical protein
MLDDIDKGFCLFATQISSNMAKISLSFESHGSGCTSPIVKKWIKLISSLNRMKKEGKRKRRKKLQKDGKFWR